VRIWQLLFKCRVEFKRNLFKLQLEVAQEMKNYELKQQMMNISGEIKKVGQLIFFLFWI
jgi:hypothetical protein